MRLRTRVLAHSDLRTLGFRMVWGLGSRASRFKVWGLRFKIRFRAVGFKALGFRALGFRASGFRVACYIAGTNRATRLHIVFKGDTYVALWPKTL